MKAVMRGTEGSIRVTYHCRDGGRRGWLARHDGIDASQGSRGIERADRLNDRREIKQNGTPSGSLGRADRRSPGAWRHRLALRAPFALRQSSF